MSDYVLLFPGVFTEKEKTLVEKFLADNRTLNERGKIDNRALINGKLPEDTPGVGPSFTVVEAMVRYNNQKYDPENAVLNDAAYARKLGFQDIIAYPTFGANDDTYIVPYPPHGRDQLLVSQLNHSVTSYKPVYPGDTLYLVSNSRHMRELTPPEGSIFRSVALRVDGSIYNQKGEKVNDVIFRVTETIKIFKEGKRPKKFEVMDRPDWMRRPAHYYTDDDWEYIKGIWAAEKRRGSDILYWEDVKIGDEPAWTADGPIEESVIPTSPYGMGTGGSRTMKKEIMDPVIFKTMIRGENDGIYRLPNREDYVPPAPVITPGSMAPTEKDAAVIVTSELHRSTETRRGVLVNFFGRDIAIRHINNWMGDHGWLHNIRWGIIPVEARAAYGSIVPANPDAPRFLEKVPRMKNRHLLTHGLTGDLALVKSCVYDKYVNDGKFMADLAWWIETIDGYIWEEGGATVILPSKGGK